LVTANSQWRAAVHGYLASVSYCDDVVGRILSALDSSKYGDNTWIILWGDNGFHLGEKLHWRKFALWEEATRVPLIIVPPKRLPRPTSHVHDPVSLIDIYPTLVDIAGLPAEPGIEGMSLIPSMDIRAEVGRRPAFGKRRASPTALRIAGWRIEREPGGEADPRAVLTTWGKNNHSIRISDWRLTRYADETLELYDHRTDPYEWTNLATDDRYREVIASLLPKLPQML
jgi:arylsulfatase A-like enzyme